MPLEIERRFLVTEHPGDLGPGVRFTQGWLVRENGVQVRVRHGASSASVTCKIDLEPSSGVPVRLEIEEDVDPAIASCLLDRCFATLEKTRHVLDLDTLRFEIDTYHGPLEGLVIAEVELTHAGVDVPALPWLGREVTRDKRYGNLTLAQRGLPG